MTDVNVESADATKEDPQSEQEEVAKPDTSANKDEETSAEENVEKLKTKEESELDKITKERDSFKEKFYYLAAEHENAQKRFERESQI